MILYQEISGSEDFFKDFPDQFTVGITQREVDKLKELIQGKGTKDMVLDLSKNPDPIIAIIRVFSRAHDLYYTDYIPSGRTGGKVSNKTMRDYSIPRNKRLQKIRVIERTGAVQKYPLIFPCPKSE